MNDLQPLLVLLIFVPTLLASGVFAALNLALMRLIRMGIGSAKAVAATCWLTLLSAALWIGCDHLMRTGQADNGAPFAAILVWIVVVLPAPFAGSWLLKGWNGRHGTRVGR